MPYKLFKLINGKEHYYAEWLGLARRHWGGIVFYLDEYCSAKEFTDIMRLMIRMAPVVEHLSMDTRVHPGDWEW